MQPENFAADEPRAYRLPAELDELKERYAPLGPSDTLKWVFDHVERQNADAALLEHEYVDGDFRDEYANFYIKVFRNLPDRCERLHFWTGQRYLGYCSIRPIKGQPVCRTMLDPGDDFEDAVSCLVKARANPYGRSLEVPPFPFISQDRQYGRCAHAVLWMVSHYHHLLHDTPACSMSDIVNAATEDETERVVPSRGLTEDQIGSTLRRIGLPAVKYRIFDERNEPELNEEFVRALVLCYLNSSIPVVLGTPGHLTALTGARRIGEDEFEFICCDDEEGAYRTQSLDLDPDSRDRWTTLFVPLPGRIYLLEEEFKSPGREMLRRLAAHPESRRAAFRDRRVRFRTYVVDSRVYKRRLESRGLPGSSAERHLRVSCPRWIWMLEVQDAELAEAGEPACLGELAVDATSDGRHSHFLFGNLPGLSASWSPNEPEPEVQAQPFDGDGVYETGTALGL